MRNTTVTVSSEQREGRSAASAHGLARRLLQALPDAAPCHEFMCAAA